MGKRCGRSFPGVCEAVGSSHPSQVLYALPNTQTHPGVPCAAKLLMLKHRRWIQQGKRGRSLCDSEHLVRPQGFVSPWIPAQGGGCPELAPRAIPSLFPSPQPSAWGKGRLDKTSPFCSTKLVSQPHWAYNYYFLKDEPSSYRQKSPLLSELEFDVLTTVFVPRLRGKSSAGGGKRDLIIELHCDFAHIAGCCNQVTSVSDFLPSPPSSSSFSFSRFFFFFFFPSPFFLFSGPN